MDEETQKEIEEETTAIIPKSISEWVDEVNEIWTRLFGGMSKMEEPRHFVFKVVTKQRALFQTEGSQLVIADTFFEKEGYLRFFIRKEDGGTDAVAEFTPGTWLSVIRLGYEE